MEKLLAFIRSWFDQKSYGEDLQAYVAARQPQSAQDVERYVRDYERIATRNFPYY